MQNYLEFIVMFCFSCAN